MRMLVDSDVSDIGLRHGSAYLAEAYTGRPAG